MSKFYLLISLFLIVGCATTQLETSSKLTRTIVIDHSKLVNKTIYLQVTNTANSGAEKMNLNESITNSLKAKGYEIIGVSADSVKTQKSFAEKYHLNLPLIADTDKNIIKSYGAWGKKKMYGKEYEGIMRYTFLISEDGIIQDIITQIDTKHHSSQILEKDF